MTPFVHRPAAAHALIVYPESDGLPMADNTEQYDWIVRIQGNLDLLLPDAFVGGNLLWYPTEGDNLTRGAPDVLVALGRPKGHRSSFMAWKEGGQPEVVFEVWSPSNDFADKLRRLAFFDRHGVLEFYAYDPQRNDFTGFVRGPTGLAPVATADGWVSPLLGVRFAPGEVTLEVFGPQGAPFLTFVELGLALSEAKASASRAQVEAATARDEAATAKDVAARAQDEAAQANAKADAFAAQLRALGIEPDAG
jgi:Uma2 family endonuclease